MAQSAIRLLLQCCGDFGVCLFVINKGTKRRPNLVAERHGERRSGDDIRSVFEKEANQGRLPRQQYIGKRNGPDLSAIFHEQLHEIQPSFRDHFPKSLVLLVLGVFVPREQFNQTMEFQGCGDLKGSFLYLARRSTTMPGES
jgi:hypothetical protein